jgi:hypothetical protein
VTPEDLVEIELIKQLKYRYLRCIDQKLWDDLDDLFVPDAVASYSGGAHAFEGRDAIVGFLRDAMASEQFLSSHRCHHPEISLTSPTTATGIWALEDTVLMLDYGLSLRGAAFYTDEYVKDDGTWRISSTGYKRTFEEIARRDKIPGLRLTASWWGTDGRSELG